MQSRKDSAIKRSVGFPIEEEDMKAARVSSNITLEQAAKLINVTPPTYMKRENNPRMFSVNDLAILSQNFNQIGSSILCNWIHKIF